MIQKTIVSIFGLVLLFPIGTVTLSLAADEPAKPIQQGSQAQPSTVPEKKETPTELPAMPVQKDAQTQAPAEHSTQATPTQATAEQAQQAAPAQAPEIQVQQTQPQPAVKPPVQLDDKQLQKCREIGYVEAMDISEKTPEKIFNEPACFMIQEKAINIFVSATKTNPQAALVAMENYIDAEWADEVVNTAASRIPETYFRLYKTYKEAGLSGPKSKKIMEALKNNLKEAAFGAIKSEDYFTVLAFADLYVDQDWAKDAVIAAGKKDLLSFLSYRKVQEATWFKKFLKEVVFATIEENPGSVLESADGFIEEQWSKEAIASASEKDPESAFKYFKLYSVKDWCREILARVAFAAADKNPWVVLEYAPLYAIQDSGSWFWKIFPERGGDRDYLNIVRDKIRETGGDASKDGGLRQFDVREADLAYMRQLLEKRVLKTNHDFLQSSSRSFFQGLFNIDQEPAPELKLVFILDNLRASSRFNGIAAATSVIDLWVGVRAPMAIREIINMEGRQDEERLGVIRDFNPKLLYEAIVDYNGKIPKTVFIMIFSGGNDLGPERKNTLVPKIFDRYKGNGEMIQFLQEADPKGQKVGRFLQICSEQGKLEDFLNYLDRKEDRQRLFAMNIDSDMKVEMLKYISKEDRQSVLDGLPAGSDKQKLLEALKQAQ